MSGLTPADFTRQGEVSGNQSDKGIKPLPAGVAIWRLSIFYSVQRQTILLVKGKFQEISPIEG